MRNDLQLSIPSTQLSTEMVALFFLTYALKAIDAALPIAKVEEGPSEQSPSNSPQLRTLYETKTLAEIIKGKKEFNITSPQNASFVESSVIFSFGSQHATFAIGDDSKFQLVTIGSNGELNQQTISFREQKFFDSSSVALKLEASKTVGNTTEFADISAMQTTTVGDDSFLPTVLRRVVVEKSANGALQKVTISFNPMTKLASNDYFLITPGIDIEITNPELLSNSDFIASIQNRDSFFKKMGPSIMVYPDVQNEDQVKIAGTIPVIRDGKLEFRQFSSSLKDQSWSAVNIHDPKCENSLPSQFDIDKLLSTQSFCINEYGIVVVLVDDDQDPNKKNILTINATSKSALKDLTANLTHFVKKFDPDFKYLKTGLAKLLFDATRKCFREGKDLIDEISKNVTSCLKDLSPEIISTISSAINTTLGTTTSSGTTTTGATNPLSTTPPYGNFSNSTNSSSVQSTKDTRDDVIIGVSCLAAVASICCIIAYCSAYGQHKARIEAEERLERLDQQSDPTGLGRGGNSV